MKLKGTLEREDLGAGVWKLRASDGRVFVLDGDIPPGLARKPVEVEGEEAESMGFGMTGDPTLVVASIRRA